MTNKPVTTDRHSRDNARTYDAYSLNIQQIEESIPWLKQRIEDDPKGRNESRRNLIFIKNLEAAKVMYCRGDAFEAIHQPIIDGVEYVLNFDDKSNLGAVYVPWLQYAALAILLKMPESIFRDMKMIVDRHDERDQVLDHLLSFGTQYEEGEASHTPFRIYNNFDRVIECCRDNGERCQDYLLDYLNDEWHNGTTILASTKHRANTELPYDGVYCFPVAAMAYINKLDDTELRKSEYYPSDIADYAHR